MEEGISKTKSQAVIKGPWMVVNKSRRRKIDNTLTTINTVLQKVIKESSKSKGSRFSALEEEWEDRDMDITVRQESKKYPPDKTKNSSCNM